LNRTGREIKGILRQRRQEEKKGDLDKEEGTGREKIDETFYF
jgi:hypothetical protein